MHESIPVDTVLPAVEPRSRSVVLRNSFHTLRSELSVAAGSLGRLLTPAAPEAAPVQWDGNHLWIGLA